MSATQEDVQTAHDEYLKAKNDRATFGKNNENEKEFYTHIYIFNWMLFMLSVFLGYKTYKLYITGPPIWDSMSSMVGTITFGFLGKTQQPISSQPYSYPNKRMK